MQDRFLWNQAKRHLRRYNGILRQHFHLFIKEWEWRFNYGPPDQLLKTLRAWLKPYAKSSKSWVSPIINALPAHAGMNRSLSLAS